MRPRRLAPVLIALSSLWSAPAAAIVFCEDASRYIEKSTSQDREAVLRRVVALCPRHAAALNNLAVLLEERGDRDEAEELYRRAITADPDLAAPYAGLGDVMSARQDHAGAAVAYERFLAALEEARQTRPDHELARFAPLYRDRLEKAREAAAASGQTAPTAVVSAGEILRSLTTPPRRTRGIGLAYRSEPHIDIHIRFDFDSARLRPEAHAQLDAVAEALGSAALHRRRILIEGHTDSTGPGDYNRALSERRAEAVRAALLARGIADDRMATAGYGESRPISSNATVRGQAVNRRVTFVNAGAL